MSKKILKTNDLADVKCFPFVSFSLLLERVITELGKRRREKGRFYSDKQEMILIVILTILEYWVHF